MVGEGRVIVGDVVGVAVAVGVVAVGVGVVAVGVGVVAVGVGVGVSSPQLTNSMPLRTTTAITRNKIFFIIFLSFLLLIIGKYVFISIFRYYHLLPAEQP
jgi:hypothetical protein